jgi:hypothetical protein
MKILNILTLRERVFFLIGIILLFASSIFIFNLLNEQRIEHEKVLTGIGLCGEAIPTNKEGVKKVYCNSPNAIYITYSKVPPGQQCPAISGWTPLVTFNPTSNWFDGFYYCWKPLYN